jgi:hypothetical protein
MPIQLLFSEHLQFKKKQKREELMEDKYAAYYKLNVQEKKKLASDIFLLVISIFLFFYLHVLDKRGESPDGHHCQ